MAGGGFFAYPGEDAGPPQGFADDVLLPALDEAGWQSLLSFMEIIRVGAGAVVFTAGEADQSLYLVADGVLEHREPGGATTIETGGIVGELGFFDGQPHPATAIARTDVDLYQLSPDAFAVMAAREPVLARTLLLDLGRILAQRLRRALTAPSTSSQR